MKKLLLFIGLLILNPIYAQTNTIDVPEVWETDSWDGVNWNVFSQLTYTFSNACLPTTILSKVIDFGGTEMLEDVGFVTVNYNAQDEPTGSLSKYWDDEAETWEDNYQTVFTVVNGNITEVIGSDWINGVWEPSDRETRAYNSEGLMIQKIEQDWGESGNDWVNDSKIEYTYNLDETLNVVTNYEWSTSIQNWVNNTLETYSYSSGLAATLKTEDWNGSAWGNDRLRHYTYDSNEFLIETLKTKWNGDTYDNEELLSRTNNADGNPTETITQAWFFGNWVNTSRDRRTYPSCATLSTQNIAKAEFRVYPNPAQNHVNVQTNISGNLSVIDIHGRQLISQQSTVGSNTVNTALLTNGMYLLSIENQNTKTTKRLVIDK
ncbi:T9SS type A sorting domain-containing protein [Algibacter miyuki]|uniref:T9SS type A sorting domain-containing protein n=1 Tax=Algibacter miyuki TaxID=1306933 RepID=A0ABV5GXJ8_9FLAO|nr:T9SS type A sorting domain-containing protein [Algibacter miyuki]MDN3665245.1 T9SS type A sorting domain-containing protein [Algibacter miyuki]